MDLLSQRYADPFFVLNEFIRLQQLHDFSVEIIDTIQKEKIHDARWEYYLHKVWDNISFEDYVRMCEQKHPQKAEMTSEEVGSVINESYGILNGFNPGK